MSLSTSSAGRGKANYNKGKNTEHPVEKQHPSSHNAQRSLVQQMVLAGASDRPAVAAVESAAAAILITPPRPTVPKIPLTLSTPPRAVVSASPGRNPAEAAASAAEEDAAKGENLLREMKRKFQDVQNKYEEALAQCKYEHNRKLMELEDSVKTWMSEGTGIYKKQVLDVRPYCGSAASFTKK